MLAVETSRPPLNTYTSYTSSAPIAEGRWLTPPLPSWFLLPDLVAYCPFELTSQPNAEVISTQSTHWLVDGCPELSQKKRTALFQLRAGQLTSLCYPYASDERFRVICDFIGHLFHLDNISDGMMKRETNSLGNSVMNAYWCSDKYKPTSTEPAVEPSAPRLARDYWQRCIEHAGPGTQARFKEAMGLFFEAVKDEATARDHHIIPTMEQYVPLRRDNGGCKAAFALIEYGLGIDLPDYVAEHPVIEALNRECNDFVAWSNDIYSWNVEQARGDTTNMVVVVMTHHNLSLQQAIDYVGALCCRAIDRFLNFKARLPRWGPQIDHDVQLYVKGLEDWIVGSLHFNFLTDRYFGQSGEIVKKTRLVQVMEKKIKSP